MIWVDLDLQFNGGIVRLARLEVINRDEVERIVALCHWDSDRAKRVVRHAERIRSHPLFRDRYRAGCESAAASDVLAATPAVSSPGGNAPSPPQAPFFPLKL